MGSQIEERDQDELLLKVKDGKVLLLTCDISAEGRGRRSRRGGTTLSTLAADLHKYLVKSA